MEQPKIRAPISSATPRLPWFMSNPLTTTTLQTAQTSIVVGFHAKRSENTVRLSQQWSAPGLQKVSVKESHGNRGVRVLPKLVCFFHRWWAGKAWEMGGSCSVWLARSCATVNSRAGLCYSYYPHLLNAFGFLAQRSFSVVKLELFLIGRDIPGKVVGYTRIMLVYDRVMICWSCSLR